MRLRLTLLALPLALAALGLAACGGSSDDLESATTAKAEDGALPATVEHKYGTTTIEEAPKRIVVTGLREQDALLALGDAPVATTEWYGKKPGAIFPWAERALGESPLPEVLDNTDGIQFEEIARLDPDLIVSIYSDLTEQEYGTLSQMAPTLAPPADTIDFGSTWDQELAMVGEAVGKPAAAEEIQDETEDLLASTAAEYPEFEGRTAAYATFYDGVYVYGPKDPRTLMLNELGFEFPEGLKEVGGDQFGGNIPDEEVDRLDLDVTVWFADPGLEAKIKEHPVYRGLAVRRDDRDLFMAEKGEVYDATTFVSPLSIPVLADRLPSLLSRALRGEAG